MLCYTPCSISAANITELAGNGERRAADGRGAGGVLTDAYGEDSDHRADDGILNEVWFTGSNEGRRLSARAVVVGRVSESEHRGAWD